MVLDEHVDAHRACGDPAAPGVLCPQGRNRARVLSVPEDIKPLGNYQVPRPQTQGEGLPTLSSMLTLTFLVYEGQNNSRPERSASWSLEPENMWPYLAEGTLQM